MKPTYLLGLMIIVLLLVSIAAVVNKTQQTIGPTETVVEVTSGIEFLARIDTGATTCSIHTPSVEIKNAEEDPDENIGKQIRFQLKNKQGESAWLTSSIFDTATIRTSEETDQRYKVWLTLNCDGMEKRVLATLNDRSEMKYPVLIGRNFLKDDFVVDVSLDNR